MAWTQDWKQIPQANDAGYVFRFEVSQIPLQQAVPKNQKGKIVSEEQEKEEKAKEDTKLKSFKRRLNSHPYAPLGTPDAFYIRFQGKALSNYFDSDQFKPIGIDGLPLTKDPTHYYVSLRWLRELATDKLVDSRKLFLEDCSPSRVSKNFDFHAPDQFVREINDLAMEDNEKEYKDDGTNKFELMSKNAAGKKWSVNRLVPIRTSSGALVCLPYKSSGLKNAWTKFWKDEREKPKVTRSRGWRTRYEPFKLSQPLLVVILPQALSSLCRDKSSGEQRADNTRVVFERIIAAINMEDLRSPQLQLAPSNWDMRDHSLLSEDPFRLYQTYIHKQCINEYMLSILREGTSAKDPIRALPDVTKFENDMIGYLKGRAKPGAKSDDQDEDEEDATYDDEDQAEAANAAVVVNSKANAGRSSKTETELLSIYQQNADGKTWTTSTKDIELSLKKVDDASGSRSSQKSQKDVMGFSASHMAEKVLGWKWHPKPADSKSKRNDRQMSNGLYIAEWLHLCAYSWGGVNDNATSQADLRTSSQQRDNLVFGTSEANSCMTRYEKAWQQLFRDESLIAKKKAGMAIGDPLHGTLSVTRNDPLQGYLKDSKFKDAYIWEKTAALTKDDALSVLASRFKFLAYNIRYEIRLKGTSPIIGKFFQPSTDTTSTMSSKVWFYPFSRRFYHRAEHKLDSALYQHMFIMAVRAQILDEATANAMIKQRFQNKPYVFASATDPRTVEKVKEKARTDAEKKEAKENAVKGLNKKDPLKNPGFVKNPPQKPVAINVG